MKSSRATLLTSTSQAALRKCPRLYWMRYELGLTRVRKAQPLRFGAGYHKGLELWRGLFGQHVAGILETVLAEYAVVLEWADPVEWAVERETLRALLTGYFWRYGNDNLTFASVEQAFGFPLRNPSTGHASRRFKLAGKWDGIVRLSDGRLLDMEYKTSGEDISPDADYWRRLRYDGQISLYVLAARAKGYDVAGVLYDVTRKPTIRLRQKETPEQYGQRLLDDIGQRPDYYYQRREIPRLEDDLARFQAETWQLSRHLLDLRKRANRLADPSLAWFRNISKLTCGQCEYADVCLNGMPVDPACPPAGFQILASVHPELEEEAR